MTETMTVAASAALPYSEHLAKSLTFLDRFNEKYTLYRVEDGTIHVPRGFVNKADYCDMSKIGSPIYVENHFEPYGKVADDQVKVVAATHKLLDNGESFIVQAPTGYGKTYLGAEAVAYLATRTLIITTKEDIIDQWRTAIKDVCGLPDDQIGVWRGDQTPEPQHRVVIALVQSLAKGPERYPAKMFEDFGLTICDEVHRMGAEHFNRSMWWVPSKYRIGYSATPYRKDGRENAFKLHIGEIKVKAKLDMVKPKIIAVATDWKVPMVSWYGTYQKMPHSPGKLGGLVKKMAKSKTRNNIIAQFAKAADAKARHTIIFSDSLAHLQALQEAFVGEGIQPQRIGYYVGLQNYSGSKAQKLHEREQAKTKHLILATYSMASEATDIPWLDCAILATPRSDVNQIVGRIRREFDGKKQPVVLDLVDTDSRVLSNYWKKRKQWYEDIGADIVIK